VFFAGRGRNDAPLATGSGVGCGGSGGGD